MALKVMLIMGIFLMVTVTSCVNAGLSKEQLRMKYLGNPPEDEIYLRCGVPDRLAQTRTGKAFTVGANVHFSEKLNNDEWRDVLQIAERIPRIDREIVSIVMMDESSSPETIRIQTQSWLIFIVRDVKSKRWRARKIELYLN